jgi:hypothetical protein
MTYIDLFSFRHGNRVFARMRQAMTAALVDENFGANG